MAAWEPASNSSCIRSIHHEYTLNWAPILERAGGSLLISTYQADKLVVVAAQGENEIEVGYRNFDRAMGVATAPGRIAVGSRDVVWVLKDEPAIAPKVEPGRSRDGCFLTRYAIVTGEIAGHEIAWDGDELWVVNTLFSCLCTLDTGYAFVPRWKPRFISAVAAEDRCHLNGFAFAEGRPRFVTALGESDSRGGWRENKATGGILIDVASSETMVSGLCMPHSPRLYQGQLWLLDSGRGHLLRVDLKAGTTETVADLPGYARGLTFWDRLAFVGLSKIRETSTFGGLPISERREGLKCGVAVIDLSTGRMVGLLQFHTGVDEIFDVQFLANVRSPVLIGPHPHLDATPPVWLAGVPKWEGR